MQKNTKKNNKNKQTWNVSNLAFQRQWFVFGVSTHLLYTVSMTRKLDCKTLLTNPHFLTLRKSL